MLMVYVKSRDTKIGFSVSKKNGGAVVRNRIKRYFRAAFNEYKNYLIGDYSKGLNTGCIFTPTCSEYAMDALEKYGFFSAFTLILFRILRCNSLSKGGFDPVPDNPKTKKWLY